MSSPFIPQNTKKYRSLKIMFHKKIPKYHFSYRIRKLLAKAYYGAGYIMYDNEKVRVRSTTYYCYDMNSAYQYALLTGIYPLKSTVDTLTPPGKYKDFKKRVVGKLWLGYIEVSNLKNKYEEKNYNLFKLHLELDAKTMVWRGWLCNIDIETLLKIYKADIYVKYSIVFNETGLLGEEFNKWLNGEFEALKNMERGTDERKERKTALHIATYGKSAQKDLKSHSDIRSIYIPIAIFQTAYVREKMVDLSIKYNDSIAYCDTDSCYITKATEFKEPISQKIGEFKIEQKNVKIEFFRRKAYIIYDSQGKIIQQKISGINRDLTIEEIKKLRKGQELKIDVNGKIYTLQNKIKNGYKIRIV